MLRARGSTARRWPLRLVARYTMIIIVLLVVIVLLSSLVVDRLNYVEWAEFGDRPKRHQLDLAVEPFLAPATTAAHSHNRPAQFAVCVTQLCC